MIELSDSEMNFINFSLMLYNKFVLNDEISFDKNLLDSMTNDETFEFKTPNDKDFKEFMVDINQFLYQNNKMKKYLTCHDLIKIYEVYTSENVTEEEKDSFNILFDWILNFYTKKGYLE